MPASSPPVSPGNGLSKESFSGDAAVDGSGARRVIGAGRHNFQGRGPEQPSRNSKRSAGWTTPSAKLESAARPTHRHHSKIGASLGPAYAAAGDGRRARRVEELEMRTAAPSTFQRSASRRSTTRWGAGRASARGRSQKEAARRWAPDTPAGSSAWFKFHAMWASASAMSRREAVSPPARRCRRTSPGSRGREETTLVRSDRPRTPTYSVRRVCAEPVCLVTRRRGNRLRRHLAWESDVPHDCLVSWLGRDRLERRVIRDLCEFDGTILIRPLQRRECRLFLTERIVNQGDAE